jgi:hypothetical protein
MMEQSVHAATVEKTAKAYASLNARKDVVIEDYRGTIHKHPGNGKPSPSGQDMTNFAGIVQSTAKNSFWIDLIGSSGSAIYVQLADKALGIIAEDVDVTVSKEFALTEEQIAVISKMIPKGYVFSYELKRTVGTIDEEQAKELVEKYVSKIGYTYGKQSSLLDGYYNDDYYGHFYDKDTAKQKKAIDDHLNRKKGTKSSFKYWED